MIPWDYKKKQYGTYLKMNAGNYPYKVYFYEGEPVEIKGATHDFSCKDIFPIAAAKDKDEFCNIVKEALQPLNDLDFGVTFEFLGHDVTDKYGFEFVRRDGMNALVYYNHYLWGGLALFFPDGKEFGCGLYLSNTHIKNKYIGELRHEITHCLGFGHKATSTTIFSGEQLKGHFVISGLNWKEGDPYEFSEDTIHGIDTVYDIDTKFAVSGSVRGVLEYDQAEAFLVRWHKDGGKRRIIYQTPIDATGHFEFSLRQKDGLENGFKILCVGKNGNGWHWNELDRQSVNWFRFWKRNIQYNNINMNLYTEDNNIVWQSAISHQL